MFEPLKANAVFKFFIELVFPETDEEEIEIKGQLRISTGKQKYKPKEKK